MINVQRPDFFTGQPDTEGLPEISKQFVKPDIHSQDAMLKASINRKYEFSFDRPF